MLFFNAIFRVRAVIVMLLCVLCWSTSGLFITLINWHPMVISGMRSAIAAFFMAAVHGRAMFSPARNSPALKLFALPALPLAALASAATKMLYVTANKLTAPANAILLQHTAPVWVALAGGVLLGERLRKGQRFAAVLAAVGVAVFLSGALRSGSLAGDALALCCGVTFALSMIALRALKEGSPARALFWSHIITVACALPFVIMFPPEISPQSMGAAAFLGLVQVGAASLLYGYAMRRISAMSAALIAQIEPILNPVWVFLFMGEVPGRYAVAGGALIIAAVVIDASTKRLCL